MVDKVEKVRKDKDFWVKYLFDLKQNVLVEEFRAYCRSHPWLSKNRCARYVLLHHYSLILKPGFIQKTMRRWKRQKLSLPPVTTIVIGDKEYDLF